jgi:hypothetical protein
LQNLVEHVKTMISRVRGAVSKKTMSKLDLDKCERIVERIGTFSASCEGCHQHLLEVKNHFTELETNVDRIEETTFKRHRQLINHIISHLQKEHKLIAEGYYLAIFMSIGMSIGVAFGLTIFDNIGLGIPIGMCFGLAIGAGLDADAKKKGNTI